MEPPLGSTFLLHLVVLPISSLEWAHLKGDEWVAEVDHLIEMNPLRIWTRGSRREKHLRLLTFMDPSDID